jgi:hypothetical protein
MSSKQVSTSLAQQANEQILQERLSYSSRLTKKFGPPSLMRLHFMAPGVKTADQLYCSNLASTRLRIAVPARYVSSRPDVLCSFGEQIPDVKLDALLVGKIGANNIEVRANEWLAQIVRLRERGVKIILDYTDNHLTTNSVLSAFYTRAVHLATDITVPSEEMRLAMHSNLPVRVSVIPDALEYASNQPRETGSMNGIWFGHGSNLPYLIDYLRSNNQTSEIDSLTVCSDLNALKFIEAERAGLGLRRLGLIPWSIENLRIAMSSADFALLPVGMNDPRKSGAGPNRLLTALAHGVAVFTQRLSSYAPLSAYFFDIDTLKGGLTLENVIKGKAMAKIAQERVIPNYQPKVLAGEWLNLMGVLRK